MYISPHYKPENMLKRYISIDHGTNAPVIGETDITHLWVQIRPATEEEIKKYAAEIEKAKWLKNYFPNWVEIVA